MLLAAFVQQRRMLAKLLNYSADISFRRHLVSVAQAQAFDM